MIIGVPAERKDGERRVALTPDGASLLCRHGHQVLIETGAGEKSGFTDAEYISAGAQIAESLQHVWKQADLLTKVKEPSPEEYPLFRPGLGIFSFLHPAVAPEMTEAMLRCGITGIDFDLVILDDGRMPILEPMSQIAGKLSVQCGAYALQAHAGGRGILLGGVPGVKPAKVVIIGAGAAGGSAAEVSIGIGADVTILDINAARLAPYTKGPLRAKTAYSSPQALEREVLDADLIIGSVLVPGARAPKLLSRALLTKMKPGAVIVDICIDQGGFAESSVATTISNPTYVEAGIVHYCVPNMPALVPRTSTLALTAATLPWLLNIAEQGVDRAIFGLPPLRRSVVCYQGKLTNKAIGEALSLPFTDGLEKI